MDINSENRDEIIFSYVEGLMDEKETDEFEALLQKDETLRAAVTIFKRTSFVMAEPLSNYEDLSQELIKSNFTMKWIWLSFAGFLMIIGGVYAIYLFQNQKGNPVYTTSTSVPDSASVVEGQKETVPQKTLTQKVLSEEIKGLDKVKSKFEATKILKDTTAETSRGVGLPLETQVKVLEVSQMEDKKVLAADTFSVPAGLKANSQSVPDSSQKSKNTPMPPKTPKPKTVKKLNIKGTEEIKTNSSLY